MPITKHISEVDLATYDPKDFFKSHAINENTSKDVLNALLNSKDNLFDLTNKSGQSLVKVFNKIGLNNILFLDKENVAKALLRSIEQKTGEEIDLNNPGWFQEALQTIPFFIASEEKNTTKNAFDLICALDNVDTQKACTTQALGWLQLAFGLEDNTHKLSEVRQQLIDKILSLTTHKQIDAAKNYITEITTSLEPSFSFLDSLSQAKGLSEAAFKHIVNQLENIPKAMELYLDDLESELDSSDEEAEDESIPSREVLLSGIPAPLLIASMSLNIQFLKWVIVSEKVKTPSRDTLMAIQSALLLAQAPQSKRLKAHRLFSDILKPHLHHLDALAEKKKEDTLEAALSKALAPIKEELSELKNTMRSLQSIEPPKTNENKSVLSFFK